MHEEEWFEGKTIGIRYVPPEVYILSDCVRFVLGWFFPNLNDDESACYIELFINSKDMIFHLDYYPYKLDL